MSTIRERMKANMHETLADNARHHNWSYWATRPLYPPARYILGKRIVADCSKGAQYIAHWSSSPDPLGRGYDGYGNSSSAAAHLPHLDYPSELQVGDFVTFGFYGNEHMAVVLETGSDPLLWSDGHPGAPNTYRLSYDRRIHQLLHNPVPNRPLTPAEKLRKKEGFWAWYQWSLGLGFWKKYGKRNKKVRPNVPKRVPLKWWKHRARLLVLRRKRRSNKASM